MNDQPPARQASLRRQNLGLVLRTLAERGAASRAHLAVATGLTKATVSSLMDALIAAGLVAEGEPSRGAVGRPGSPLTLNGECGIGLGIEIHVDYVAACATNLRGEVRALRVIGGDNRAGSPQAVIAKAVALAQEVAGEAGAVGSTVFGVGVSVAALVQGGRRTRTAPHLPSWQGDIPIADLIAEALGLDVPVEADNEANFAALGEFWYGGHGLRDFVLISGEIGVGGGVIVGGELFRGVRGFAGELGHIMIDPAGPECVCGARGCLEQYAGQESILRAAGVVGATTTRVGDPDGPVHELVRRAQAGDARTLAALAKAADSLGCAVATMVNVLDVPGVVLGGVYAPLAPWLVDGVTEQLRRRVLADRWDPAPVVVSTLGILAGVRGAAGLSVKRIIRDPQSFMPSLLRVG